MKKISFVNVSNNDDLLKIYQLNYEKKSGVLLPVSYLKNAHTMLLIQDEKVLGGYVLNTKAPYRYLSIFTDEQKQLLLKTHLIQEHELLEVTCSWLMTRVSLSVWIQYYVVMFVHTIVLAIRLNKRKIIGGSVVPKLQLMQRQVMTKLIYCSFIHPSQGIICNSKGIVMIYYNSIVGFCIKMMVSFTKRLVLSRIIKKKVRLQQVFKQSTDDSCLSKKTVFLQEI